MSNTLNTATASDSLRHDLRHSLAMAREDIEIFVEFLDEGGVGRPGQNSEQIGLALVDASQQIKRALRRWGQILDDHATQGEQHASPFRNPRP